MDIIYSRNNKKNKYIRKVFITTIIIVITADTFINIYRSIDSSINDICVNKAKEKATYIYNEEISKLSSTYSYNDICNIYKNNDGTISMIQTNTNKINEISSKLAINIQDSINNNSKEKIKISIGSFTKSRILNGRGLKINITICTMGNVKTKYISKFEQAGINQVLHKVYIETSCEIGILNPLNTITQSVTSDTLFMENLITGTVPDTYYNLEGLEKGDELNVLN